MSYRHRVLLLSAVPLLVLLAGGAPAGSAEEPAGKALDNKPKQERLLEAQRLWNEAQKLAAAGKTLEATAATEKVVATLRETLGCENDNFLNALDLLAELQLRGEDFEAARKSRQEILALRTKMLGSADWRVTDARLALADVDQAARMSVEARKELAQAVAASRTVDRLYRSGSYTEAIKLAKQVLDVRRRLLGEQNFDYATSLNSLALLYYAMDDYARAEPLCRQALEIFKKTLGEQHPNYATVLNNLAALYKLQGDYARAEPLYRQALELLKKTLGEQHPHYAVSLNNLATFYDSMGDYAKAEPLCRKALEIRKKALGVRHPDYATNLTSLANVYRSVGQYTKARPLYEQALEIRKNALGKQHPDYAASLDNLARLYHLMGDHTRAETLYRQSLEITKRTLGEQHPEYATSLDNLAKLFFSMGDYAQAEKLCRQSLQIAKKARGEQHPDYACSLSILAGLFLSRGDYVQAEPLYRQELEITKRALGERHPHYATSLNNLAALYDDMGDYARAEPLYQQALEIRKKALGEQHPQYSESLNNLAALYCLMGDLAKAEPILQSSLKIERTALGQQHPSYARSLNNLAAIYVSMGDYAKAEPLCRQALDIRSKTLGEQHPDYATCLGNLADLYKAKGDYATAERHYLQVLNIQKKTLGELHLYYVKSLVRIADSYRHTGDHTKAEAYYRQALSIGRKNLELASLVQSQRQQLAMAQSLRHLLDRYLSLTVESKRFADSACEQVAVWKGIVLTRQQTIRAVADRPDMLPTFAELQQVSSHLATLAFDTSSRAQQQVLQSQIAELSERKERLEKELSGRSALYREATRPVTLSELRAVLPPDAVLVDFLEYWQSMSQPKVGAGNLLFERRLLAFVYRQQGDVELLELGPVDPLHKAIDTWRTGLGATARSAQAGQAIRDQVWAPVERLFKVENTPPRLVLVSLDGSLGRLPLAALPGREPGTYLVEDWLLATLAAPQVLFRVAEKSANFQPPRNLLVVGDVDYDARAVAPSGKEKQAVAVVARGVRAARDDTGRPFATLAGTKEELNMIAGLYRDRFGQIGIDTLNGTSASKGAVCREAPRHTYLHIATHGFFAAPQFHSALDRPVQPTRFGQEMIGRQTLSEYHPGLLSGLAFTGANKPQSEHDGILTAEEIESLDLSRVELATLSACETGLGQTAGGEGMLGLQRAFQVAGCRNVVASLWKVDDAATAALMKVFYHKLWQEKKPPIVALREAQLAILRHPEQIGELAKTRGPDFEKTVKLVDQGRVTPAAKTAPPRLWAAFVISGAPAVRQEQTQAKD